MSEVRAITSADVELFRSQVSRGFGRDIDSDETARKRFDALFEYDRTFAVFDGDDIVGTGAGFSLGVTVPGGAQVPMGGTTIVTVQPTHRRQGLLRQLMGRHLDDVAARGEPLAGLWASEGGIYERFGYGVATSRYKTVIKDAGRTRDLGVTGNVRLVNADVAEPMLRHLYEQLSVQRPGMLSRTESWWTHRVLADVESWRGGASSLRYAIFTEEGTPTGYAMYRQRATWDDFTPAGEISVEEVVTVTPGAHAALWGYLINIDLFPNVEVWNLPLDDPLPSLVADSRRVRRTVSDALWVRVMDVPAALEARQYETDGAIVIGVTDAGRPSSTGSYRIEVVEGTARCELATASADVVMDIDVLGHLYLGGGNAVAMSLAGRLSGDPKAVTKLHRLFRTDVAPWCPFVF